MLVDKLVYVCTLVQTCIHQHTFFFFGAIIVNSVWLFRLRDYWVLCTRIMRVVLNQLCIVNAKSFMVFDDGCCKHRTRQTIHYWIIFCMNRCLFGQNIYYESRFFSNGRHLFFFFVSTHFSVILIVSNPKSAIRSCSELSYSL